MYGDKSLAADQIKRACQNYWGDPQSWTKMLRKMHVVYVILEYFPLKPGSLKIFPPPPKKAMLKCGPNIFAAY